MGLLESAGELLNFFFRPATAEDGMSEPGKFFGHGAAQAAGDAGNKNDLFGHKKDSLQTLWSFVDAAKAAIKDMLTAYEPIANHAASSAVGRAGRAPIEYENDSITSSSDCSGCPGTRQR